MATTTNRTTRSPKESVPNTSDSNCQFGTSVASVDAVTPPAVQGEAPARRDAPKSRRPGTKSLSASISAREAADEAFAARMAAARARIAPDLYGVPRTLAALRLSRGLSQTAL